MRSKASHPGGAVLKNPLPANAGDTKDVGTNPRSGRSLGVGNGKLQYSCLENPMYGRTWWAIVHWGHKESDMTAYTQASKQTSNN